MAPPAPWLLEGIDPRGLAPFHPLAKLFQGDRRTCFSAAFHTNAPEGILPRASLSPLTLPIYLP